MQNQHVETSSRPPAAVTSPPGGRRRTSPAICHPGVQTRHALVRISLVFPTPVGVASASLRAVPSFPLTASFHLPSPSTPIPIFRRMRRPEAARGTSAMRRSISPVSDPAPGALLLREHYLLRRRASSSRARNHGPGRRRGERRGVGADVKWPGGCLGSLEAIGNIFH